MTRRPLLAVIAAFTLLAGCEPPNGSGTEADAVEEDAVEEDAGEYLAAEGAMDDGAAMDDAAELDDMQYAPPAATPAPRPAARTGSVEFCVEARHNYRYVVAIGYYDPASDMMISKGWWSINNGQCRTVLSGQIGDVVYIRANYGLYRGEIEDDAAAVIADLLILGTSGQITGDQQFCFSNEPFEVFGNMRCASRNYNMGGFRAIPVRSDAVNSVEFYTDGRYRAGVVSIR